jgi:nicotinamidase-related amidase
MNRRTAVSILTAGVAGAAVQPLRLTQAADAKDAALRLSLRSRLQPFKGVDAWEEVTLRKELPAKETALLLCDMWDDHWCKPAAKRCAALATKMAPVIAAARAKGVQIIHAPSDCMDFYKDAPQRRRILEVAKVEPPKPLPLPDPALPCDTTAGGCDDDSKFFKAWKRQHEAIAIADADVISDKGAEVYSFIKSKGIKTMLYVGVHTNMCVLHRTFAIKPMTRWGVPCVLVRDLTDAMYDPRQPPKVSHDEGTDLIIQYIEKYWCPSILSADLTA